MREGHCDLDIFLDPFLSCLWLPGHAILWFPVLDDLREDLLRLDASDPSRNLFVAHKATHPFTVGGIARRITAKFVPPSLMARARRELEGCDPPA